MATSVGFIGVGNMGNPMALNVLKAGFPMSVFDMNQVPFAYLIEVTKECIPMRGNYSISIVPDRSRLFHMSRSNLQGIFRGSLNYDRIQANLWNLQSGNAAGFDETG